MNSSWGCSPLRVNESLRSFLWYFKKKEGKKATHFFRSGDIFASHLASTNDGSNNSTVKILICMVWDVIHCIWVNVVAFIPRMWYTMLNKECSNEKSRRGIPFACFRLLQKSEDSAILRLMRVCEKRIKLNMNIQMDTSSRSCVIIEYIREKLFWLK